MVDSCWLKRILPFSLEGVLTNELLMFRNLFKRGKWLFGISLFIRGENDGKNLEERASMVREKTSTSSYTAITVPNFTRSRRMGRSLAKENNWCKQGLAFLTGR